MRCREIKSHILKIAKNIYRQMTISIFMQETETKQIILTLDSIKKELQYIKEHMVDADSILTESDFEALQQYREEKKTKQLTPHVQLKKELGL